MTLHDWGFLLGSAITILSTICGASYTVGQLSQRLVTVTEDVAELKSDFKDHTQEDTRRFDALQFNKETR